jgi:DNA-binding response OmpR family regulator
MTLHEPQRILIAEDDEFLAKMYQQKLMLEGYHVIVARDGEQAIEYLSKQPFAAVLLDILMPKKNGFEVLTKLRASTDHEQSKIPVLVVSNLSHDQAIRQSMLTGANDYIVKPGSTPSEVTTLLKQLVPSVHV